MKINEPAVSTSAAGRRKVSKAYIVLLLERKTKGQTGLSYSPYRYAGRDVRSGRLGGP